MWQCFGRRNYRLKGLLPFTELCFCACLQFSFTLESECVYDGSYNRSAGGAGLILLGAWKGHLNGA